MLLGVSAGIAAYKSALIVRLLKQAGCEVRVVMTEGAQAFITPLTLQALSGEPVRTSLLDPEAEAGMGHIELARWADLVLIAPATADLMARLVQGVANDLLAQEAGVTRERQDAYAARSHARAVAARRAPVEVASRSASASISASPAAPIATSPLRNAQRASASTARRRPSRASRTAAARA